MPWSFVSRRLGLRLGLLIGILLLAYGATAAFLAARTLSANLLEETRTNTLRLVEAVERSTRYDMENTRWEDVHRTIENVGAQEGIEHVRIYNKDGRIMYSSAEEEISTVVDLDAQACTQCHKAEQPLTRLEQPQRSRIFEGENGHRVLAAIDVIYNEPGCWTAACHAHPETQSVLGVIDIGVSLEDADGRVAAATTWALGFGLGSTALVCALVSFFIHRFVGRPLKSLLRGIHRVSEGDLEATIPVSSEDEVGEVANSFNRMTEDLAKARAELSKWAETLEKQVEDKTRDLKIAQEQVVRSEKLSSLGILAAGVAHELNSPLTGILTFAHLMLKDAPEGTQAREDLQVIVNETNRCAAIIRQLLDFSRENAPEKRPRDLDEVVGRAVQLVERQALFQNVSIERDFDRDLPQVELDASQMEQVFLNLLVNAAEAMPKGGRIRIRGRALGSPPDRCAVEFSDSGSGIPEEILGKVFDPFFSSKSDGTGTGLGLAVSYGIIKRHGGTIEVTSEAGAGTTFTITLPARVQEALTA